MVVTANRVSVEEIPGVACIASTRFTTLRWVICIDGSPPAIVYCAPPAPGFRYPMSQPQEVRSDPAAAVPVLRLKRGEPSALSVRSVGVDLGPGLAGFRARRHAGVIDLDREGVHDPRDFWEPLEPRRGELLLDPGEFYILASKDPIEIPVLEAAEMTPIDPAVGEFRVHYAGFFDPGFGTAETDSVGARGVLEVRSHETPFLLEDGQTVARLVYQPLTERPARLYGENGSHYQRQGLQLSKHFKAWL